MVMELVVESAVAAMMSAVATDVWPRARERMARALRPADPAGEGATLESLVTRGSEVNQRAALLAHMTSRLREHPERIDDVERSVYEVDQILIEAHVVRVDAHNVHVHGSGNHPSEATKLAVMNAARAAHELQEMDEDVATALLSAMPVDAAARRLALMTNAQAVLSNMDEKLAANLLTAMPSPDAAKLFSRIEPERGVAVLSEMAIDTAVRRMAALSETDPGRAALLLFSMNHGLAAQLLAELSGTHPRELFSRMSPDRAGAILAVMSTDKAVWRLSEMDLDRAATLLSKMDRSAAVALLSTIEKRLGTNLLARMTTSDGAEVLAKMDIGWARDRLAELEPKRALELLVALRPPRSLLKEINNELAGRLLPAAVAALARRAEDAELIDAAQTYADRIKADAEARVHQILAQAPKPVEPEQGKAKPSLGERIMESLRRHNRQTVSKLAHALREPETEVRAELARLVRDGKVFEHSTARSAVSHYSFRV